jgi:hypothetical protein
MITQSTPRTCGFLLDALLVDERLSRAYFAACKQPHSTVNKTASLTFLVPTTARSDAASEHPECFKVSMALCEGGSW